MAVEDEFLHGFGDLSEGFNPWSIFLVEGLDKFIGSGGAVDWNTFLLEDVEQVTIAPGDVFSGWILVGFLPASFPDEMDSVTFEEGDGDPDEDDGGDEGGGVGPEKMTKGYNFSAERLY